MDTEASTADAKHPMEACTALSLSRAEKPKDGKDDEPKPLGNNGCKPAGADLIELSPTRRRERPRPGRGELAKIRLGATQIQTWLVGAVRCGAVRCDGVGGGLS